jgi:hypothetical protein
MVNAISMTEESDVILCTTDFKIRKKLNYKEMNIEEENSEIIFGFKNRDEKILDKILQFAKEDCYKAGFQLASLRIEKYLKELRKTDDFEVIYGLLNLGRNEDLDRFIKYENKDVLCKISNIGRPKDLDVLINCVDVNVVNNVLKNRRKKDINKYIENPLFTGLIINVEFDWFLDEIMNNSKIEKTLYVFEKLIKIGRKKDLDEIIKIEKIPLYLFQLIANVGFDEHLDYISKYIENENVLKTVLQFHRKCDYDRIKARGYKIDDDVCDKNLLW